MGFFVFRQFLKKSFGPVDKRMGIIIYIHTDFFLSVC